MNRFDTKPQFAHNPVYREYEGLLIRLHELLAAQENDTPEVERVHDRMDEIELALSAQEIARLNGLSADLYMLQDNEIAQPTDLPPSQIPRSLAEAFSESDWDRVLSLLRTIPEFLSPAKRAYIRARSYEGLGHDEASFRFMDYAARQDPQNHDYDYFAVVKLLQLERDGEAQERISSKMRTGGLEPALLIKYAGALFLSTRSTPVEEGGIALRLVVRSLESILRGTSVSQPLPLQLRVFGLMVLGSSFQSMCEIPAAIEAFDQALELDHDNVAVIVRRGMLRAQTDIETSILDLKRAIDKNTSEIEPYLYVAHHALSHSRWNECLQMCDRVKTMVNDPGVLATVLQWTAISKYCLGEEFSSVLHIAQRASDLDPLNQDLVDTVKILHEALEHHGQDTRAATDHHPTRVPRPQKAHSYAPRLFIAA